MQTMEEIVREYCLAEVVKQICNQNLTARQVRRINAEVGWRISGSYSSSFAPSNGVLILDDI